MSIYKMISYGRDTKGFVIYRAFQDSQPITGMTTQGPAMNAIEARIKPSDTYQEIDAKPGGLGLHNTCTGEAFLADCAATTLFYHSVPVQYPKKLRYTQYKVEDGVTVRA